MYQLNLFQDTKKVLQEATHKYSVSEWLEHEKIQQLLDKETKDWSKQVERQIFIENPYYLYQEQYENIAQNDVSNLNNSIQRYKEFLKFSGLPDSTSYWQKELEKPKVNKQKLMSHLLGDWKKNLDQQIAEWDLKKIDELRKKFIDEFIKQLQDLEELKKLTDSLGLETGIFLDYSKGNLTAQDIAQFKQWAEYLRNNASLAEVLNVLGKIQSAKIAEDKKIISQSLSIETYIPDINSREEIIGIKLAKDLELVLPSELALLSDPETEFLFDLKFIESNLMCFEMQGLQPYKDTIEQDIEVCDGSKGPMILCIDTSGSMNGTPEYIAKATALYFAIQAMKEKRKCFLINFSTSIEALELTSENGLKSVIDFLKMSFRGGTDVAPALAYALQLLEKESYKKADILVVSDFIMASLDTKTHNRVKVAKENKNQFFSLVIGYSPINEFSRDYFDREWLFNPRNSSVTEIVNLIK
ncbi:VWA domain-containing protein [Acinetobacter portensis]|uniref:VWA domain-containing protein n=1 Tax=Acinetobacter portensis TaxID=1839785 RepID=UPI0013D1C938|nr:VWA domain-containing protein [Acinetobacter portensis]